MCGKRGPMKKFITILACALCLTACGDDDSSFAPRPDDDSSIESSSSSVTPKSNDSETSVSSSSTKSSSSVNSSSSSAELSSSSVTLATPCKTETEDNCEYGELVDDRDGQVYKTVKIGDQWWMAQNLNYETDNSFCYNDSASYCEKIGRLYLWSAAMDSVGEWSANGKDCGADKTCSPFYPVRGVCPEDWHLPTQTEWRALFMAVGGESTAGKVLKSTSGWNRNGNGTDAFSFSALPAGNRSDYGSFIKEGGSGAEFWSSTEYNSYGAYDIHMNYNDGIAYGGNSKGYGYSVRCLKD